MSDSGGIDWRRPRINEREEDQVQRPCPDGGRGQSGRAAWARMHAENVHNMLASARLAAVADPDAARAEALAERCGSAAVYRDPVS